MPGDFKTRTAFSLVELLAVIGVMGLACVLLAPVIGSLGAAGNFSGVASVLSETTEAARAYAVSKRTYVYVGIGEFKASAPENTGAAGTGRVALLALASLDGTRITQTTDFADNTKVRLISGLIRLGNVHLVSIADTSGGMQRPSGSAVQQLGMNNTAIMQFPLSGTPQYSFGQCIEFTPEGMARVFNSPNLLGFLEIGIAPTKGDAVVATSNVAALQISGLTGKTTLYRPSN